MDKKENPLTKESIESKIKTHGETLQKIVADAEKIGEQIKSLQNQQLQLAQKHQVTQGAIMQLQDLLKELEEVKGDNKDGKKT